MKATIVVDSRLRFRRAEFPDEALDELREQFTHRNPVFHRQRSLGFRSKEPARIETWSSDGEWFSLPRGGTDRLRAVAAKFGVQLAWDDRRVAGPPEDAGQILPHRLELWPDQLRARDAVIAGVNCLLRAPTGCHAVGQLVLMYDGSAKRVEEVEVGDLLMGSDGDSREVLELRRGRGQMYEIVPTSGEPFVVNEDHVLTLQRTRTGHTSKKGGNATGRLVDVSVIDYLGWSKTQKHIHKLIRTGPLEFSTKVQLPLDPYFYGVLLGDGWYSGTLCVATTDPEILEACIEQTRQYGLLVSTLDMVTWRFSDHRGSGGIHEGSTTLRRVLEAIDFVRLESDGYRSPRSGEKRVHPLFLRASVEERLKLLAGLMDTDGSLSGGGFDFISKSSQLAASVVWLARSVGLGATFKKTRKRATNSDHMGDTYWRVCISGDVERIPCKIPRKQASRRLQKKSVLRTGFTVRKRGVDDYYGFLVDGDHRYVLGDSFLVTHNSGKTSVALAVAAKLNLPTIVIVWSSALGEQWRDRVADEIGIEVGWIGGGKYDLRPLTVALQQSLRDERRLHEVSKRFGVVICDEVQRFAAKTFVDVIDRLPAKYRLGFSADESRKDQKEFLIYDQFGKVAANIARRELEQRGRVTPVRVVIIPTDFAADWYVAQRQRSSHARGRPTAPDFTKLLEAMTSNDARNALIQETIADSVRNKFQTLVFTHRRDHVASVEAMAAAMQIPCGRLVGGDTDAEAFRRGAVGVRDGTLMLAVGTYQAIGHGLDLPSVSAGLATTPIHTNRQFFNQVRGRLCRVAPGKSRGYLFYLWDRRVFGDTPVRNLVRWNDGDVVVMDRGVQVDARRYLEGPR